LRTQGENGIGTRLKAARQRLGWNRETLAFHSGISWSAIAQIETGRRANLRPNTLQALAGALGVTIDYLVTGGGPAVAMLAHDVLLYTSDEEFLETAAPFLADGAQAGEAVLAVTTEANIGLLRSRLGDTAREIRFEECARWYDTPSRAFFGYRTFLDSTLEAGAPWVRILGEPPLSSDFSDKFRVWMRYEALLTLVFAPRPVSLTCPYDVRGLDQALIGQVRAIHPDCDSHNGGDYADSVDLVLGPEL
jgi:transcriptional regulator with XRE-family HTH domain